MAESILEQLNSEFPGRKEQINDICEYFPEYEACKKIEYSTKLKICTRPAFPHILLCGLSGTGRSSILLRFLQLRKMEYIFIRCIECRIDGTLCIQLLHGLNFNYDETCEEVENLADVIDYFLKAEEKKDQLKCIIFKDSENLTENEIRKLSVFQETLLQNGWCFSLVFIADDNENLILLYLTLVSTFFPRYTNDQLVKILMRDFTENDQELFQQFLNVFLPAVTPVFSDLYDIQKLVRKFYKIYKRPVEDGVLTARDVVALSKLLLSEVKVTSIDILYTCPMKENQIDKNIVNLSYSGKVLLVAAFLCSYVPKKADMKFFCTKSMKKKKRSKSTAEYDVKLGPKPFSFHRLLAVYKAIGDFEKVSLSLALISQVATLVEIKLLAPVGSKSVGNLDDPTYKCLADFDLIVATAKNIDIDVTKYVDL